MEYSEKKKQIISTAEQLFSSKGYDGTSVRDIADEAGVNIAMISYYFGSKEKLMEALFEQRTTNIKLKVESLLHDEKTSPFEKVLLLAQDYINRVHDKKQFFKIMICEQVINKNPVIIHLIHDLKKRNVEEFAKLITDGQQKGAFRKDVDVSLLMQTLVGVVTQVMLSVDYYREYNDLKNISDNELNEHMKQKLTKHIKVVFKSLLSHEA